MKHSYLLFLDKQKNPWNIVLQVDEKLWSLNHGFRVYTELKALAKWPNISV